MFWKKKAAATPTGGNVVTPAPGVAQPPAKKVEVPKSKAEKLAGPREIPQLLVKHLAAEKKIDADWARLLKAVVRRSPKGKEISDVRVFDDAEAMVKKVTVKDYTSLDAHPELIIYEGWFDEESKRVELVEKKKVVYKVPLFTETEIRQKIEGLSEPGSTVFFYMGRGPNFGGPLGRGAAVVELNPQYQGKHQKKYIVYTADVDGLEPVGKGNKLFATDKSKEISSWIKDAHHKRCY